MSLHLKNFYHMIASLLLVFALIGAPAALVGCNTVGGAGEDLQETSQETEQEMDDAWDDATN